MFYRWIKAYLGQGIFRNKHKLGIWKDPVKLEERGGAEMGAKRKQIPKINHSFIILLNTSPTSGLQKPDSDFLWNSWYLQR